jgi:Ca-activated chloride channel homolog
MKVIRNYRTRFKVAPDARERRHFSRFRRGVAIVFILFILIVMLVLSAFAINLAQVQLVRTEMQVATDASARAAIKVYTSSGDFELALATAQSLANKNLVNSTPLNLSAADFGFGTSTRDFLGQRYQFQGGGSEPNALHLRVEKRAGTPSGPVELAFPIFGATQFSELTSETIVTQVELDIALVVDRSGSMAYAAEETAAYPPNPQAAPVGWNFGDPVPSPSRWLDTIDAVQIFLDELEQSPQRERVLLVTYAGSAAVDHDLSEDYIDPMEALSGYSANFQSGDTNISAGMQVAANQLISSPNARPWASKVIVVLTDGIHTQGSNPRHTAKSISQNGVMIFTVTFAAEANQSTMQAVASAGGGSHYHATNAADLADAFRAIARKMPTVISH